MKILKKIMCGVIISTLLATAVCACLTSARQNTTGRYSALSTVTERSETWILEQFGHCQSIEELLAEMSRFACDNFVYWHRQYGLIQDFQLDTFLFEEDFHGVCHDFSCFAKCVVLVWSQARQQEDIEVYIYDLNTQNNAKHSYNFIRHEGRTWYIDLTSDVTRAGKGMQVTGAVEITGTSIPDYMASYGEVKIITH